MPIFEQQLKNLNNVEIKIPFSYNDILLFKCVENGDIAAAKLDRFAESENQVGADSDGREVVGRRQLAAVGDDGRDAEAAPQRLGARIAPLIGAKPSEVIVADSTSVNLFKLLVAAAPLSDRKTLLSEAGNFPTDLYIAQQAAEAFSRSLRSVERDDLGAIERRAHHHH